MNYFPNGDEENELVKFIARYQYLKISDANKFFASKKYYRNRIKSLIDKKILRRIKWNLVLGEFGIEYVKQLNYEYNKLNRNKKYMERLFRISNLAAYYHNCKTIEFTPSFSIKNKECFTTTGRRFIGILKINGYSYLTYYISHKNDNNILHNNFNISIPIFYKCKFIYSKSNRNSYNTCYCDSYGKILKNEVVTNNSKFYNESYYIYKEVNNKIYYRYFISISKDSNRTVSNYIKEKVYLNNNSIYKVESLENKNLTEEEYQDKLKDFKKYFEENKQEDMIYVND